MRYEDEIDRSRRRQSRGRETVKRSGNRNPAPNRQKELTLITDSFKEDARRRNGRTEEAYGGPQKSSSRKKTSKKEEKNRKAAAQGHNQSYRASAKKKAKKKRRRIALIALWIVLLLGTAVFAGYKYLDIKWKGLTQRDENWNPDDLINLEISEEKQEQMEGYWTIAVFGLDSRNGSVGKGNNSDVNIICNLNWATGEIRMASIYRDTYLNVSDKNSYNKINSAFLQGGPTQAVKALNKNLDLEIDDYAVFNWKAVAEAINILGGVDIEITKKEFYYINAFITETVKATGIPSTQLKKAGMNHLDGVQAVAYGRLRLMDTDYERTARQRKVISLAFEKAKKADWATLNNVIQTLLVTEQDVDTSIDLDDIVKMARGITKLHMGESYGFPEDRKEGRVGSKGDCVIPNTLESNVVKLHSFLFGDENYEPSSQVKNISNKIASDCGAGGKKETPKATKAPETEALSTEDLNSTEATGSHGETSPSHEYWYPWESETDDGATGPGKATRPYETGSSPYPGETHPGGESRPAGEHRPGGGTQAPQESESSPGSGPTQMPQESSSGIIIYPEGGENQNGVQKPGTEQPNAPETSGGQNGSQNTPGQIAPGGGGPENQTPGQYTDTGVILNPGSVNGGQPGQ